MEIIASSSSLPTSASTFPADDVVTLDIETSKKVEAWIRQEFDKLGSVKPEKRCEKLSEQLQTFNVPDLDNYIFYEVNFARLSLNSVFEFKRSEFLRLCLKRYIVPFEVVPYFEFQYVAFVEGTKLVVPYVDRRVMEDTPANVTKKPKQAIIRSFQRTFEDKALLGESFLSYLSRHYNIKKLLEKKGNVLRYYAPFMAANQSSGSGKSRLLHEISEWVLPVIISGPNPTGLPRGSSLLSSFTNLMGDSIKVKNLHMHSLMTATHNFLSRTIYHAICARIKTCKEVVSRRDGKVPEQTGDSISTIPELTEDVAEEFFRSAVDADAATAANPLSGIAMYLEKSTNMDPPIIDADTPRETKFECISGGGVDEEKLTLLLNHIRNARVTYLVKTMGQNKDVVNQKLGWLPHVLLVFDEAHHLTAKLNENAKMTVIDEGDFFSTDPFKIFRRTTRNSNFYWTYAWSITVSTNSSMSNFSPTREDDPSVRDLEKVTIIPPFIYEDSFDIFAHDNYRKIWQPGYKVVPQNGLMYIYSWDRIRHILSCGRPLFYSFVEAKMGSNKLSQPLEISDEWPNEAQVAFDDLITMIGMKMNGGNSGSLEMDKSLLYALFAGSVGMYSFPEVLLNREDMIRRRLSWVVSYNIETKDCEIAYPSEGIFNCVLSLMLDRHLVELLKNFSNDDIFAFFNKPGFKKQFSYWQVTEVLARLMILLAFHRTLPVTRSDAASTESMLERMSINFTNSSHLSRLLYPRLVKELFYKFSLLPNDRLEIDKFFVALGKEYDGALTTFGYFQEVRELGNPLEFVQSMLFRGSAKYFSNTSQPGADAVLPLVMADGSYGVILVQIYGVQANVVDRGEWPIDSDDLTAAINAGLTEDTYPNSFVKKNMRLCTIEGVFGFKDQSTSTTKPAKVVNSAVKSAKLATKRLSKSSKEKFVECANPVEPTKAKCNIKHCIRIIINLKPSMEKKNPRIRFFQDLKGPVLAIQTDGNPFLMERELCFVKDALSFKARDWQGNLPRFEAHLCSPPANDREPYNPAFYGYLHDDDISLFKIRGVDERLYAQRPRDFYPK